MVLMELLRDHEELATAAGEDGDEVLSPDLAALFFGRNVLQRRSISIGPEGDECRLEIEVSHFDEIPADVTMPVTAPLTDFRPAMLKIRLQGKEWLFSSAILSQLLSRDPGYAGYSYGWGTRTPSGRPISNVDLSGRDYPSIPTSCGIGTELR